MAADSSFPLSTAISAGTPVTLATTRGAAESGAWYGDLWPGTTRVIALHTQLRGWATMWSALALQARGAGEMPGE